MTTKTFKVATVSQNTNAFGLNGVVLVAADGEAFEAASYCMGNFTLARGETVSLYVSNPDALNAVSKYSWVSVAGRTFEIPRALAKAPVELLRELFPDVWAKPEVPNRLNMDNPGNWETAVKAAVNMGLTHAKVRAVPATETELIRLLNLKFNCTIVSRHFQARNLRIAYGAAFNGIDRMREVRARDARNA